MIMGADVRCAACDQCCGHVYMYPALEVCLAPIHIRVPQATSLCVVRIKLHPTHCISAVLIKTLPLDDCKGYGVIMTPCDWKASRLQIAGQQLTSQLSTAAVEESAAEESAGCMEDE
jgi:hypothetical protein